MGRTSLRFLSRPHACSYCQAVHGVTFSRPPRVRPRLLWVRCRCGRSHYVCFACARRIGVTGNGQKVIAQCARGYIKRMRRAGGPVAKGGS